MGELNDDLRHLLAGRYIATLSTEGPDGSAHLTPVWYLFEDDKLYVGCPSSSRKARNVSERPKVSLVVDVRRAGSERWVSASGSGVILSGEPSQRLNKKIVERYLTDEAMNNPSVGGVFLAGDDATICLSPETWRSWDAKSLDEQVFGGILGESPEKWFRPLDP